MSELHANLLLRDLALVMIVAAVVTLLFHRLRQPVVLGYILAGALIGPHLFRGVAVVNRASIDTLAELGVVFIMFSLGMDFSLRTLRRIGSTAVIGAVVEIAGMIWIGYELGRLFGWSRMDSLFLGAILSISSTTITVKVLTEMGRIKERFAQLSLGILIVEDILAIGLIALLSGVAITGEVALASVLAMFGKIAVYMILVVVVGLIAVPRLLRYVVRYHNDEMLLVTVLGLCFGVSLLTVLLGYSVALGAFLIGTIIGEAREIGRVKVLTEPVRDMFSAVFFVSIGMLLEPRQLVEHWGLVVAVTAAVVVGKVVTRTFGVLAAGNSPRTAVQVAMTLAQIGEFSFIIAALGMTLKVTSDFIYPVAVTVSVVTTLLTPYLVRSADPLVTRFDQVAPRWLVGLLELYSGWIGRVRTARHDNPARRMARRWAWQIAINVALVSGLFVAAVSVAGRAAKWWPDLPATLGGAKGVVWLVTAVIALPALIAAVRKLQALAMLLSEMSGAEFVVATVPARKVVYHTVFVTGCLALGVWVMLLSSALLPGGPALVVLVLMASLLTIVLWRFFIQVHARAQVALLETFLAEKPAEPEPAAAPAPSQISLLRAEVAAVAIAAESAAAGRLIRELELRSQTGASIVAIERADQQVINPGPDEELRTGDRVLLLGTTEQLANARQRLLAARQ